MSSAIFNTVVPGLGFALLLGAPMLLALALAAAASLAIVAARRLSAAAHEEEGVKAAARARAPFASAAESAA